MTLQKKILVLADGSERSMQTIDYVNDFIPADKNLRIVLFHVFKGLPKEYETVLKAQNCANELQQLKDWEAGQEKKIHASLEQMKNKLIAGGFPENQIEIKLHPLKDGVARDIINEARNGYGAVVLRRRGMGALKSIILGSVAVKLLQTLTFVPILIVGQAPPVKKVLLAMDGSLPSMKAAEFVAATLGGRGGYEVCIFHVILGLGGVDFDLSDDIWIPDQMPENCLDAFKSEVARWFQVVKSKLTAAGFEPEMISEKIVTGAYSRSETIVKEAEAGGYSTIVIGRRELSKVDAFFMGRIGHKVVYGGKYFTVWVV